ncbi:MAG: pyridoxal-phosphate dependent enzyme [Metallosphaera sp.]|uniref:Threonine synthase n=1 Tax=Metallosphaera cuprina (strain Ar-4) TaxID=1006006 RepID=F4G292_METCR|nr:pyridoxal-phosphate dependent enzyme [Metallosphaera cuprina]AEB94940.1 threonine synthase [Metallosphaera cuprina Ar-4]
MKALCMKCGREREGMEIRCKCGGAFKIDVDIPFYKNVRDNFPYVKKWVSLGEWNTPLIRIEKFWYKLDLLNPTGSYKDRGSVTLISRLYQEGVKEISEDSSGNAGASIAAYGALAGMKVKIFVPSTARGGKLKQIQSYGAEVVKVEGSREEVAISAERSGAYYASHVLQPEFRDGIRSLAYEIVMNRQGKPPSQVFLPTSAGTLLLGVYEGFNHMLREGIIDEMPKIIAVQTEEVSPVCSKLKGKVYNPPVKFSSIADALVSTNPVLLDEMVNVLKETGDCVIVNEREIIDSWNYLRGKGLLVEYSSAVGLAGARKLGDEESVIVITGNGLKVL